MFPWATSNLLGLPVYLWIYLLGFIFLCAASTSRFLGQRQLSLMQCMGLDMSLAVGAVLGAKVFELIDHLDYYLAQPQLILSFSGHGVNGGILFGTAAAALFLLIVRKSILAHLDVLLFYLPIAIAIGRVSCLITADGDYGTPTDLPWGMRFPFGYYPTQVPVHPTPIYEIIAMMALFVLLKIWVVGKKPAGWVSVFCLVVYAGQRFLIEFIRLNQRHALGLTLAQWACALLFLLALGLASFLWLKDRSHGEKQL